MNAPRSRWRALAARAGAGFRRREAAVIVPVPVVERALAGYDDPGLARPPGSLPPHVTLLYPFGAARRLDAAVEDALAATLSGFAPFRFRLARVELFPDVMYLAPEPAEPFIALTEALAARWPEHPPYGGAYDRVVPHVTVATGATRSALAAQLERALPIDAEASEIELVAQGRDGAWGVRATFPLGRSTTTDGEGLR